MTSGRDKTETAFDDQQYALPYSAGAERHFWNYARNRIIERHLRSLLGGRDIAGAGVLDVGCGPGIAVDYLRKAGIDCHGVELGNPVVRPGVEQFVHVKTDAADLPQDLRLRTKVILLLDVIEHIEDPVAFLNGLLSSYPAVQHFLITVPARMELWSSYDDFYGHFRRYDAKQVENLAAACGLRVKIAKYFFQALYPVMRGLVWRTRERSLETPPPAPGLASLIHAIVGNAFVVEERLPVLGRIPGTSMLTILSR